MYMATYNGNEKKTMKNKTTNGFSSNTTTTTMTTTKKDGVNVVKSFCTKMKNYSTKIPWKILLISSVILICALLFHYYDLLLFTNVQQTNDDQIIKKIPTTESMIKNSRKKQKPQQQHSQATSATKRTIQDDYDPDAMVRFIDNVLNSTLDDFATIENITVNLTELSRFNNNHFAPRILSLVKLNPFKFVKFNLKRHCFLWPDTFSCTKIGCNIKFCDRSELPKEYLVLDENCPTNSPKELSKLDQTLQQNNVHELNRLFECSRDDSEQSQYYDLVLNPERFTGYDGNQIWRAIYEENCFSMKKQQQNNILTLMNSNNNNIGCYEERFFYRIISGLHTSITIHLTAIHHKFENHFGPNPKDYFKRHNDYLKNLFLTYLIELRALFRIQPYLLNKIQWNLIGDQVQAKDAINALFSTERLFRWHFDEKLLFKRQPIAEQLGYVFNNITFNIMDCISCDKCRLWGKVQTNGLGTAFKIMLTKDIEKLRLSHHEITCLLNAVSRLSFSITQVANFRDIFERERLTGTNFKEKMDNNFASGGGGGRFVDFIK
ncbi:endoplasmic reticulum oxidoreductin-1-like protein isoform X2 [Dermatophagoides farinae]|uniref:endoplasmic reticulum oxidoreductin-1-like protein isoform X2 n=1 Tax=Dermatophagoides farinae TaxID=6954 RepID=UPI003F5FDB31